jgi:L-ascorbate metabolism protein UlaG (beta-lactamase superfamily)
MVITHLGGQCFKVQFGDTTIAVDPIAKDSKHLKSVRFGADVALVSINHPDMNGVDQASFNGRDAFAISGPGEYEVKGVYIKGFKSDSKYDGEERVNTIYTVNLEGMNLCFLGALSEKEISGETLESLDEIDILFVPIGGEGVLTPAEAYKLAVNLEPKVVIPMHFAGIGTKESLKHFLKEAGKEGVAPADKLTVKRKDLEGKKIDVVVLSPEA